MDSPAKRSAERQRLLQQRQQLGHPDLERALQRRVGEWLEQADVHAVGFYWPIRGEPDLRSVVAGWLAADDRRVAGLPVVSEDTLEFRQWTPEAPMRAAEHGIPVPAHGRVVQPECVLIPCVGFDAARYRLGYGGGYYDRTLAALVPWPLAVGIAYELSRIDSIEPQPHDIRLDVVLTEAAQY